MTKAVGPCNAFCMTDNPLHPAEFPLDLSQNPIHLGLGARAQPQSAITGMEWYADYVERHAADGAEGRLVAEHTFTASWDSWEMHPQGAEVVYCIRGEMTLLQEKDGQVISVQISTGQYAINEPGVWHTADVKESCTALFITAGLGTQHRNR